MRLVFICVFWRKKSTANAGKKQKIMVFSKRFIIVSLYMVSLDCFLKGSPIKERKRRNISERCGYIFAENNTSGWTYDGDTYVFVTTQDVETTIFVTT